MRQPYGSHPGGPSPLVLGILLMLSATDSRGADMVSPQLDRNLARAIYKELIEVDTTDSSGNCTKAAEAMAARLKAAGLPAADLRVLGPDPRKGNLVARLRGKGAGGALHPRPADRPSRRSEGRPAGGGSGRSTPPTRTQRRTEEREPRARRRRWRISPLQGAALGLAREFP
jgi:hypothetical protein